MNMRHIFASHVIPFTNFNERYTGRKGMGVRNMTAANTNIYRDIAERCGGDVYIGVVGPVRSGKSTFIRRFMEELVLPNIDGEYDRQRASDEMPQSAGGRTIMTTEPKFVPDEAVTVSLGDSVRMRVKMVDCVGYLIPGILGDTEEGAARMVKTPWSDDPMPFEEAAENGTRRVITDHSTIGILVTSDGTFGELPRENYVDAERRVAHELSELGRPFAIVLNSSAPDSEEAERLALELERDYGAPVALVNCLEIDSADIEEILKLIIPEFPISEISVSLPEWIGVLEPGHWLREEMMSAVSESTEGVSHTGDITRFCDGVISKMSDAVARSADTDKAVSAEIGDVDMGCGRATVSVRFPDGLFYKIIGELTDIKISGEAELLSTLISLAGVKREYDRFSEAINDVNEHGYGIVMPSVDDLTLDEPEIVKQAGGWGVRLRATAPSIHMIRAGIETELSPIVGTEQQSEELVHYLLEEFEGAPQGIWNTNLFGKSIYELVSEGLHAKLEHLPEDARERLGETLSRVINEGAGGLICIIL